MEHTKAIGQFLRRCRVLLWFGEVTFGLGLLIAGWSGLLLLAVLFDLAFGKLDLLRVWVLGGLLVLAVWTVFAHGVRPWLRLRGEARLARVVEQSLWASFAEEHLEPLELVSAVQLVGHAGDAGAGSPDLVVAHRARVCEVLGRIDPNQLLQRRRLARPWAVLGLLLVLSTLLTLAARERVSGAWGKLWAFDRGAFSRVGDSGPSWIGDIQLIYHFPVYSGREERTVEGSDGSILALAGTRVEISSRTDRALAKAWIDSSQGQRQLLTITGGKRLKGEIVVMNAGSYRFELEDLDGNPFAESKPHPIQLEPDELPEVVLSKPEDDLVVKPKDYVDLVYQARDDFGLEEVRLVIQIAGRPQSRQQKILERPTAGHRKMARGSYRWELAPLELEPGERVQFTIEGVDNDSILGPKVGRSATRVLKVFSAEESHRGLMTRAQGLWENLLLLLADVLELEPEAAPKDALDVERYQRMIRDTDAYLLQVKDFLEAFQKDPLAWGPLFAAFQNLHGGLSPLQRELKRGLEFATSAKRADTLPSLLVTHRSRRIALVERDALYLEDLLDVVRLEDLERIAKELNESRQKLSELMQKYLEAPTDEIRKQIEEAIARLKEKVARLMARQNEVIKGMRDEYLNPEALAKLTADQDLSGALDRIQRLMMEGKTAQAMEELKRLQRSLDSLQASIDRSRNEYGQEKYAQLGKAVGQMMAELNQLTESQKKVMEATGGVRDQLINELKKRSSSRFPGWSERLRQRVRNIQAQISAISPQELDPYLVHPRMESLEHLKLLDLALKSRDLQSSMDVALKLLESATRLEQVLKSTAKFEGRYKTRFARALSGYAHNSEVARRETEGVIKELQQWLPDSEDLMRPEDRKKLNLLANRQSELKGRLRQLETQMQQINDSAPLFGKRMIRRLGKVDGAMDKAARELGKNRPRAAYPEQQSALAELESLRESLQKQGGKGSTGIPLPMGSAMEGVGELDTGSTGSGMNQEQVEIPKPEEAQSTEDFRKALLDGMRDPVPEDFRQQVRRYYEELVK